MEKKSFSENDQVILDLKAKIANKKSQLKAIEAFVPITNLSLLLFGERYNLNVLKAEELQLLACHIQSLIVQNNSLFPEKPLIVSGYPAESWLSDINGKYNIQNIRAEKERLKALENKLHNLLSVDTKVLIELEQLKKEI